MPHLSTRDLTVTLDVRYGIPYQIQFDNNYPIEIQLINGKKIITTGDKIKVIPNRQEIMGGLGDNVLLVNDCFTYQYQVAPMQYMTINNITFNTSCSIDTTSLKKHYILPKNINKRID